jgi:hypothetical protein
LAKPRDCAKNGAAAKAQLADHQPKKNARGGAIVREL